MKQISFDTHDRALLSAECHALSAADTLIVTAALLANCTTLNSEDLQDPEVIKRELTIRIQFELRPSKIIPIMH